jgi:hypothetical protein
MQIFGVMAMTRSLPPVLRCYILSRDPPAVH